MNNQSHTLPPFARVIPLKDCQGWLTKRMTVPAGRMGVLIAADDQARLLPEGTHKVLTTWQRLTGKGVNLKAGYVPAQSQVQSLEASYLLSGDGTLMDTHVQLELGINDPVMFFQQIVVPNNEIDPETSWMATPDIETTLRAWVRGYAASDLISGLSTQRLSGELTRGLEAALAVSGLEIKNLLMISFWKSEEKAEIAEKVLDLETRLQDIDLQKQMAQMETQAQLNEFIDQLEPGLVNQLGMRPVRPENSTSTANIGQQIQNWFSNRNTGTTQRRFQLPELLRRKQTIEATQQNAKIRRPPKGWWLPRTLFLVLLVSLGSFLTWLTDVLGKGISPEVRIGVLSAIWLSLLPVFIETLRWFISKREEIAQNIWMQPNAMHLEDLAGRQPQRIDQAVRQQCSLELAHMVELLNDVRSRVYKAGDTESALTIRDLEHKTSQANEKVQQGDFGKPGYLNGVKVSAIHLNHMLDYDEEVLLHASSLSDQAFRIQYELPENNGLPAQLSAFEQALDKFMHHFAGRARLL